jgi:hypothetical protein
VKGAARKDLLLGLTSLQAMTSLGLRPLFALAATVLLLYLVADLDA